MNSPILFASTNAGKFHEVSEIAKEYGLTVIRLAEVERERGAAPEVEENGENYYENARLKARAYTDWSGMHVLADDTGLEVDALGGAPGVHSARYAGENAKPAENRERLLRELTGVEERTARFVCTLVNMADGKELTFSASLEGAISHFPEGGGGFGYDSIFFLPAHHMTLAEAKEKRVAIETHRIKALRLMFAHLKNNP